MCDRLISHIFRSLHLALHASAVIDVDAVVSGHTLPYFQPILRDDPRTLSRAKIKIYEKLRLVTQ